MPIALVLLLLLASLYRYSLKSIATARNVTMTAVVTTKSSNFLAPRTPNLSSEGWNQ